ncbi:MAG: hypothetical protein Kow0042_05110 [Calditrichia bacterium]
MRIRLTWFNFIIFAFLFLWTIPLLSQTPDQTVVEPRQIYQNALRMVGQEQYEQAVETLRQLIRDFPFYGKAYGKLAESYIFLGKIDEARHYFHNLLSENPDLPYAYFGLARLDFQQEKYQEALIQLKQCIALDSTFVEAYRMTAGLPEVFAALDDSLGAVHFFREMIRKNPRNALAYFGLGKTYYYHYDWPNALQALEKALQLDPELVEAYFFIFAIHRHKMDYQRALQTGNKLFEVAVQSRDLEMMAHALSKIGQIYYFVGSYRKALDFYNRALKIAKELGDVSNEAGILNDLGVCYAFLGNYEKGLEYLKLSLNLFRKTGNYRREVLTLYNIGLAYKDQGNRGRALEYFDRANQLAREKELIELTRYMTMGSAEVYFEEKNYLQAAENFEKALDMAIQVEDAAMEGYLLRNLGSVKQELGRYEEAIPYHQRALAIGREWNDKQIVWEAYSGLGTCYNQLGNRKEAIRHLNQAIAIFDSIRQDLDIQSLNESFLQDKYEVYPLLLQLLAAEGDFEEAFTVAEKYKAKILLQILSQGQFLFTELLPDSIIIQMRKIRYQLDKYHAQLSEESAKPHPDKKLTLELDQKITELEIQKGEVIDWIKRNQSAYYHMTSSRTVSLAEVQQQVLEANQVAMEYIVGPEKTSVFIISPDTLGYFEIPISREELGKLLGKISPIFQSREEDNSPAESRLWNAELADFSLPASHQFYQVLIEPFVSMLSRYENLLIVPDDFLGYLPFEMLVSDTTQMTHRYDFSRAQYLLHQFNISYTSSLSVLASARQLERSEATEGLLAFGNPDFSTLKEEADSLKTSPIASVQRLNLQPLLHAEEEVRSIDRTLNLRRKKIFTRAQATEEQFKIRAPQYRLLHIATHFLSNDQQPLYSKIVFSLPPNSNEDGFLQTYEIFNLRLQADLVVLSACNTALGKLSKGEGLIGLTRAFLYAGVPSQLVSLWSVEDESTSRIMESFYNYLKKGYAKDEALRRAKLDYIQSAPETRKDPFYWAPFILVGDRQPLHLETRFNYLPFGLAVSVIILLSLLFLFFRKRKNSVAAISE